VGNHFPHKSLFNALENIDEKYTLVILSSFTGYRNNEFHIKSGKLTDQIVESLFANSDLLIFPSQYEGFGLPVLAAVNHEKPILLYDSQINRELAKIYNFGSKVQFFTYFENLNKSIENVLNKMNSYKHNVVKRTWKDVAKEYAGVIDREMKKTVDEKKIFERFKSIRDIECTHYDLRVYINRKLIYINDFFSLIKYKVYIKAELIIDEFSNKYISISIRDYNKSIDSINLFDNSNQKIKPIEFRNQKNKYNDYGFFLECDTKQKIYKIHLHFNKAKVKLHLKTKPEVSIVQKGLIKLYNLLVKNDFSYVKLTVKIYQYIAKKFLK
jgi:hypothetical protein